MLLYLLLGIMGLVVILAGAAAAHARKKAYYAAAILKRMDMRYERFVQQYLDNPSINKTWLPTTTRLAQDALLTLQDDLSALLQLVQTRSYTTIDIPYLSRYFPTVAQWVEQHLPQNKQVPLLPTETALQELRLAAQESIEADLSQRLG